MKTLKQILDHKSLVIVFAYVPAGLGHLRITDALSHDLPGGINPLLLGPEDKMTTFFHRMTSVNRFGKAMLEWSQSGVPEDIFTRIYRWMLKSGTKAIYDQLSLVLAQRMDLPKTVLIICTHFGMAYQLAAIKEKIEKEKYVKVILVLQITDDSPQHFWYVPGTDLTFAPSGKTREKLLEYGKKEGLDKVNIEVLPYPIDPVMGGKLTSEQYENKIHQLDIEKKCAIHMSLPISGAAVGMDFLTQVVDKLHEKSERFTFHIISKSTPFTQDFIKDMVNCPFVKLEVSFSSREIVDKYEELFNKETVSLEVTKPSEQSFKALFDPMQRGGALLLFTEPIGRQEYDNLDFLRRHHLIPQIAEMKYLCEEAEKDLVIDGGGKEILKNAKHWRGLILPTDPLKAAKFIWWALREKVLETMVSSHEKLEEVGVHEVGDDGVHLFWKRVGELVEEKT